MPPEYCLPEPLKDLPAPFQKYQQIVKCWKRQPTPPPISTLSILLRGKTLDPGSPDYLILIRPLKKESKSCDQCNLYGYTSCNYRENDFICQSTVKYWHGRNLAGRSCPKI